MRTLVHKRQITDRDVALMRSLFDARILTVQHLADIHFAGSYEAARKRVAKLKSERWISERTRERVFDPAILHLAKKGFDYLKEHEHLPDFPSIGWEVMERRVAVSPLTLRHELGVADVMAAFHKAAHADASLRVDYARAWPRLFSFTTTRVINGGYARSVIIRPDGFLRIVRTDADGFGDTEYSFYVELDRSTETCDRILQRAKGYTQFYRDGGFAELNGGKREDYKAYPYRVLWVCRSRERIKHLSATFAGATPPILSMMQMATLADVVNDPLAAIWKTAADAKDDPLRTLL